MASAFFVDRAALVGMPPLIADMAKDKFLSLTGHQTNSRCCARQEFCVASTVSETGYIRMYGALHAQ